MTKRSINPILKTVLELGPTLVFFVLYLRIKDDTFTLAGTEYSGFIVATLVFIPVLLAAMAALWVLTGALSRMQLFTAFMVIFFGGLTWYFNDGDFFKMKTSIVYGCFAVILGVGLLRGTSYLQWIMGEVLPMERPGWMILTRRLCALFVVLAIGNEILWRTQAEETWVWVETLVFPGILFVFLWSQIVMLQRYLIEPDAAAAEGRDTPKP